MPDFQDSGLRTTPEATPPQGRPLVGVILALPDPIAEDLRGWRRSFGDQRAELVPAHITLVTTTETDDWEATERHVRAVARRARPFRVRLEGTGSFRPVSPVVYVQVAEGFDECVSLHRALQRGPLAQTPQFPYHPHVTVAHDLPAERLDEAQQALTSYGASFTVASMGLYVHDADGVWQLREELGFGAGSEGSREGKHERHSRR